MPYAHKLKKIPARLDRRIKLMNKQREEIVSLRKNQGLSYQKLADMFNVSKRLIIFVINPDSYEKARQQFKKRRLDGRYKPSREKWRQIQKEHRQYKELIKDELI